MHIDQLISRLAFMDASLARAEGAARDVRLTEVHGPLERARKQLDDLLADIDEQGITNSDGVTIYPTKEGT